MVVVEEKDRIWRINEEIKCELGRGFVTSWAKGWSRASDFPRHLAPVVRRATSR